MVKYLSFEEGLKLREYLRLLKFARPYLGLFMLAAVFMVVSALFDGVSLGMLVPLSDKVLTDKPIILSSKLPLFLANFIDNLNKMPRADILLYMMFIVPVMFILKIVSSFWQNYIISDIGQRVVRNIRVELYTKFQALSMDYYTHKRGGEMMSRITNDVRLVENAVSYGSTDLIYQGTQIILFLFLILFIHWKLALTAFVLVPFISVPIIRVGRLLRKLSRRGQERMADINSLLYETIIGTRIVKAFNMEQYEINKFNQVNRDCYKISMKSIKRTLLLGSGTELLGFLAGIFVFYCGAKEVMAGKLSFGVFALFLGSLFSLIRPFKKISQVNSINQQALAASTRIYEVLDTPVSILDKPGAEELAGFRDKITFKDIWFNYASQEILKEINLEIKRGETLAVVGPSGTGKTTLVDLIPRFYDPKQGRILIDGVDIKGITLKSLRQQIGIVTQETFLFNDTIRANIAYGKLDATQEEIEEAASQAYAHDFIKHLPLGYETVIGDRGMKLSGGERQRIAIARALLKNPPILILDEATSQLDSESERIVQEALDRLIQGRTVFIVAHRLSTVKNARSIAVLDKGRIVEQGTHAELIARDGLYKKLYQTQGILRA